jgi:hypothetical protein
VSVQSGPEEEKIGSFIIIRLEGVIAIATDAQSGELFLPGIVCGIDT